MIISWPARSFQMVRLAVLGLVRFDAGQYELGSSTLGSRCCRRSAGFCRWLGDRPRELTFAALFWAALLAAGENVGGAVQRLIADGAAFSIFDCVVKRRQFL